MGIRENLTKGPDFQLMSGMANGGRSKGLQREVKELRRANDVF